jgi:hypothetical protein
LRSIEKNKSPQKYGKHTLVNLQPISSFKNDEERDRYLRALDEINYDLFIAKVLHETSGGNN